MGVIRLKIAPTWSIARLGTTARLSPFWGGGARVHQLALIKSSRPHATDNVALHLDAGRFRGYRGVMPRHALHMSPRMLIRTNIVI